MDFKQSNKPKRVEWISDYFMQLGAYAMAHNFVYGTKIEQGVILMCTPDKYFQKFVVNGQQFVAFQHQFLARVDQYYSQNSP
jgi:genome maintenance exonuclease 1